MDKQILMFQHLEQYIQGHSKNFQCDRKIQNIVKGEHFRSASQSYYWKIGLLYNVPNQ